MHVDASPADIRTALARFVPTMDQPVRKQNIVFRLGQALGGDGNWPGDTFAQRVGRALDALVKDGVLVKVKANDTGAYPRPDGWGTSSEPVFYTPEQYSEAVAAADAAAAEAQRRRDRKTLLIQRAEFVGLEGLSWDTSTWGGEKEITVSLDTLEMLVDTYLRVLGGKA